MYGIASYYLTNQNPILVCQNDKDKFTVDEKNGNGKLTYPVGLITLDEVVFAGFNTYYSNTSENIDITNYLYTNSHYWTFSPVMMFADGYARIGYVACTGVMMEDGMSSDIGVRPVVSLKSGTTATGLGTTTDPYVVK